MAFISCARPGAGCVDPETCANERAVAGDESWCLYQRAATPTHEQRFMAEQHAILSTAVGIARLRLRDGNVQGASDALDDAVDRCHREHFDACLADGWAVEDVERLLGPRDRVVERRAA